MTNPCTNCKKKGRCPDVCYPKRDYERGMRKRGNNGKRIDKYSPKMV